MKRLIAATAIASMALTIAPVNAAGINDVTAVASGNAQGQTITITSSGSSFTDANDVTAATITDLDGSAVVGTTFTYGLDDTNDAISVLTIATADLTDNQSYMLSFSTEGGDYGVVQVSVGTATDNVVNVSATVEPTLSLVLANTAVDLGVLSTAGISESVTDPTATVATNATGGFTLSVADTDGFVGLRSTTATKTIAATGNNTTALGNEGFDIEVSGTGTAAAFLAAGDGVITGSNQTIASVATPTAGNVSTINIRAAVSGITPAASDYATTLTFTATGSF